MSASEQHGSEVRRDGLHGTAPGREARIGARGGRKAGRGGEMVPPAEFRSYYGRSVLKAPVWESRDIAGYFFLGGVAGGSALLAAGADLTGRIGLRRSTRVAAVAATGLSLAALIHDLGRPGRFVHMLRVLKPSSPMSVGTWILSGFAPLVAVAALDEARERLPGPVRPMIAALGRPSGLAATVLAPAVTTYTGALIADTAVPVWHDARRELPYLFGASALAASGGLAAATSAPGEAAPARVVGIAGALVEQACDRAVHKRLGMVAEPLSQGRAGRYLTAARWSTRAGAALLALSALRRSRALDIAGGTALVAGSLFARLGYFHAGATSATEPRYTVVPQRERADHAAKTGAGG
ncbi:NrfD/PsrC family molybdoenzyme membrane anchor subunit [Pseudosporangium ferrugineum]|uniref:Polysulfide reductase NrfD n=1 Tax=Pseudosporangium ferrugineum TaxID=439699 RepID=A0A2T0RG43_9ACTN|nr:NrfD/PsrC family molybdoenzyme membrane anchor subunit [Pseudosporangium ferrugineum]PRY20174.1 polysulfide reductase NrfD [Pseudosporangium ferrugineum]